MHDILVVKIGGSAGVDLCEVLRDLAQIARCRPLVVVHGVSERMAQLSAERNLPVQILQSPGGHSSRYTPPPVRDLFVEAAVQVNHDVVEGLRQHGITAAGLTDPPVVYGRRKSAIRAVVNGRIRVVRDDYTGSITGVDSTAVLKILARGEVAAIPPIATSPEGALNIDGDRAAAAVASAINAGAVVILSNVRGLYRDHQEPSSLISTVTAAQLDEAMNWAEGRMKHKVLSARDALEQGIGRVIIGDGRMAAPVTQALLGQGTVFTR
jgi:acetylglutamate/LysW-gamma-L-alpha-aminoadipate kinase